MTHYCEKCGRTMDESQFYSSKNLEKYPSNGKLNQCKKCLTMHVDNWNPDTYLWILQEVDVPYIPAEWNKALEKYADKPEKITGMSVLGRYLSKMKLTQYSKYRWEDTGKLQEEQKLAAEMAMRAAGMSQDDIQTQLAVDRTPPKPVIVPAVVEEPEYIPPEEIEDEFSSQLTEADKLMLTMKWGKGYTWGEKVRMEQFYQDMMASYDIQTAGHKDTLIMICKTSLKANQLLDCGDIEGFQKMQRAYDSLMKSGKFTAAQGKDASVDGIDSIGEIVAICEREGFIPRFYAAGPQDRVDETLRDLQQYTHTLVTEETNLGNMIEAALREIDKDKAREAQIDTDDSEAQENDIMNYDLPALTSDDYLEFDELLEEEEEEEE